jgi:hypothetical protein
MKHKLTIIYLLHLFLISSNYSVAQGKLDKFIKNLSNNSLKYEVVKVGVSELKDSNRIVLPKTIVEVKSVDINSILSKYNKSSLIKSLIDVLNDPNKDWYANILLYAISQKDATPLIVINGRKDWVDVYKEKDLHYWNDFIKNNK